MSDWKPIKTAPKDEMFIWAYWKPQSKRWSVGLAYPTVSKTWADAYGDSEAPRYATHWHPMPEPPK